MSQVVVRLLRDGSGRVCIHWFQRVPDGALAPIQTAGAIVPTALGPVPLGGVRGRIACQPHRVSVAGELVGGEMNLCVHSDDVRAVTCPSCKSTPEFQAAERALAQILETAAQAVPPSKA